MTFPDTISVTELARETNALIARLTKDRKLRFVVMRNNQAVATISGLDAGVDASPEVGVREVGVLRVARPLRDEVFRKVDVIRAIAKANGARSIQLFGSAARGIETADSDLDFLVELEPGRTLLDVVGMRTALSQLFDRPVDVVTEDSLKPGLRSEVLRDAIAVIA